VQIAAAEAAVLAAVADEATGVVDVVVIIGAVNRFPK